LINTKRSFKCRYYEYSFNAKDVFANLKGAGSGAGTGAGAGLNTFSGPYAIEMSPVTLFHVLPALRSAKRARAEQSEATWEVTPELKRPTLSTDGLAMAGMVGFWRFLIATNAEANGNAMSMEACMEGRVIISR
jgi:hypothetical protein